ncbi:MAG: dihydroorotate dehydrogenase electron transfer subunit [Planctomycetota bacterium]|nr:dihydroorotate dehydrogenase electron transfer subunit [Planctomycetota bacterium]
MSCSPAADNASASFVQSQAAITHHAAVSSRYFLLRLQCEAIARRAQPGQFVMLACAPDNGGASEPLLPRPLAILDARGAELELLYFVSGRGTQVLRRTAEGARSGSTDTRLRIIGPLGRGFTPIPDVDAHVALGGGSGVAPLVFFFRRRADGNAWHLILGARTADQIPCTEAVAVPGHLRIATDDGSAGSRGTAVDALQALLNGDLKGRRVGIYAAGPEPMMRGAAQIARTLSFPARVSLEQRMACGVGVCRACVVDGTGPHPKTGLKRRAVCQDGPVFDINELAGW